MTADAGDLFTLDAARARLAAVADVLDEALLHVGALDAQTAWESRAATVFRGLLADRRDDLAALRAQVGLLDGELAHLRVRVAVEVAGARV